MLPVILMAAMAGMGVVGGIMQSQQMRAAGQAAKDAGKYQQALAESRARDLETQAGQTLASSQRNVLAERQQGALLAGRSRALAAASGADLSSPSIVKNLADLAGIEDYRAGAARYEGESRAGALQYGAAQERAAGKAAKQAGAFENRMANVKANSQLLSSFTQAGMTAASGFGGGGGAAGAAGATPATATPTGATMGGYQMGWSSTPSMLQSGSPMFQKYGQGGP